MHDAHGELVESATRGERAAIGELFERHLPGLIAFVRLRTGERLRGRESSLDVVQSACREVLDDLHEGVALDEPHFRHWLYTAAERKLIDRARHHGRDKRDAALEVRLEDDASRSEAALLLRGCESMCTPSRDAQGREELARMTRSFQTLPDDYREVIVLARIVGLSHAEIATKMDKSEGAVRVLLHRALARLAHAAGTEE